MRATKESTTGFDSVTNHAALAMFANRSNGLNGAFKAVEGVSCAGRDHFEGFVVIVSADFTSRHISSGVFYGVDVRLTIPVVGPGGRKPKLVPGFLFFTWKQPVFHGRLVSRPLLLRDLCDSSGITYRKGRSIP
jgi:hypothetical protein